MHFLLQAECNRKVYDMCGKGDVNVLELSDLLNQPGMDPNFYSKVHLVCEN